MIEFGPVRGRDVPRSVRRASADGTASTDGTASAGTKTSTCRDLVAVTPVKPRENIRQEPGARSSAAFVAHLIATAEGFPQTREKRRLAPQEAARLYGDAQARVQLRRARLGSL